MSRPENDARPDLTAVKVMLLALIWESKTKHPVMGQCLTLDDITDEAAATVIEHFAEREQAKWQEGYDHAAVLCRIKIRQLEAAEQPPSDALKIIFEQRERIAALGAEIIRIQDIVMETSAYAQERDERVREKINTIVRMREELKAAKAELAARKAPEPLTGETWESYVDRIREFNAQPADRSEDDAEGGK